MLKQLHHRKFLGMWLHIISMLVDENIPLHQCNSGHPILGCSWKFSCVIRYYLNVEQLNTETFILKLKCPQDHSITIGFCGMWLIIHVHPYSPFCSHGPHMKRAQCNIGSNTGVSESTWMSNYTTTAPQQYPVRRSNFISQYFVRCDYLSMQRHLQNSPRDPLY